MNVTKTMKVLACVLATGSVGVVFGGTTLVGTTWTIDVASGSETVGAVPTAATTVVKTGAGTAILSAVSDASDVSWSVEGGTLAVKDASYLATPSAIAVSAGATLDLSDVTAAITCPVSLAGTLARTSGGDVAAGHVQNLTLTGPATMNHGTVFLGVLNLDMGGNTLIVTGAQKDQANGATCGLKLVDGGAIVQPGNMDVRSGGNIYQQGGVSIADTASSKEIILTNNAQFALGGVPASTPITYGFRISKDAGPASITPFSGDQGEQTGCNTLTGPWTLEPGSCLRVWTRSSIQSTQAGAIQSEGELRKTGTGALWMTVTTGASMSIEDTTLTITFLVPTRPSASIAVATM